MVSFLEGLQSIDLLIMLCFGSFGGDKTDKRTYPSALGREVWLGEDWVRGEVDGLKLHWVSSTPAAACASVLAVNTSAQHTEQHTNMVLHQ